MDGMVWMPTQAGDRSSTLRETANQTKGLYAII